MRFPCQAARQLSTADLKALVAAKEREEAAIAAARAKAAGQG